LPLETHRLLGFAFASADLLMEISRDGKIVFALGASEALSGSQETALNGRAWRDFIDRKDQILVEALFDGLAEGHRAGPVTISLAASDPEGRNRAASLSVFCLPGNDQAYSCALSRAAPKSSHGLQDVQNFENVTASLVESARATGLELELALIETSGLEAHKRRLLPDAQANLDERLAGALLAQSHGGATAARLGDDRFAVIHSKGEFPEILSQRLLKLISLGPDQGVEAVAQAIALNTDAPSNQAIRAIRYALDVFIKEGMSGYPPHTLDEAINRSVKRTLTDVGALGNAVNDKQFKLVFQPVVNLKAKGVLHHHEVLVRFGENDSPFPMIRMAEELDLIEPLDLAVVEQTVQKLASNHKFRLAANVSGRSIVSTSFVDGVTRILKKYPKARDRLIIELTESAAIEDLSLADRHLQVLRKQGVMVCLDDFGAGAASLAYLQQLTLDVVKIDGRYIRELQHGGRESTFIRHLVTMCGELGVKTLAEMVETPAAEDAVRRAGVDFAQGWLYGAGTDEPGQPLTALAEEPLRVTGRRSGARESWG